jgi:hypothetical protein
MSEPTASQVELRARASMWKAIAACFKKVEKLLDLIIEQESK